MASTAEAQPEGRSQSVGSKSGSQPPAADDVASPSRQASSGEQGAEAGADGDDAGSGSEEGEEYEIESIIAHQAGVFVEAPNEIAYLVSWVGYGKEHDSWVREEDAENAADMLSEYWKRQVPKKSIRKVSKTADKVWTALEKEGAAGSSSKKRGRESLPASSSLKAGKSKAARGAAGKAEVSSDEDVDLATLTPAERDAKIKRRVRRKYEKMGDWEQVVEAVDTVERNDEGRLIAHVRFKDGARCSFDSAVVNYRCPQKIIALYESRLRWLPPTRGVPPEPAALPTSQSAAASEGGNQGSSANSNHDGSMPADSQGADDFQASSSLTAAAVSAANAANGASGDSNDATAAEESAAASTAQNQSEANGESAAGVAGKSSSGLPDDSQAISNAPLDTRDLEMVS